MLQSQEQNHLQTRAAVASLPVSVIIPVRNEAHNLRRCLESVREAGQVYVVDSHSTDETAQIAAKFGAEVIQFDYRGGWPKKRQWAMDTLPLAYDWVLLLDADEALTPQLVEEMRSAMRNSHYDGYHITLRLFFLGRELKHSGASFEKLSFFRRGKGHFECRLKKQDASMCDMEVHEHVVIQGEAGRLTNPVLHHNIESLSRYIQKHDEYSNWEARVALQGGQSATDLRPAFFGNQAQRRRWLRKRFFGIPGSPLAFFLYKYLFRLGFLDGVPGLIYCGFQGIQFFIIKAKIYELRFRKD